jgi:hypothetical protein
MPSYSKYEIIKTIGKLVAPDLEMLDRALRGWLDL